MSPVELVVFDCDGVLVDSEALVMEVEAALLTEAGFPLSVDEIAGRFVGLSYATMMAALAGEWGRPVPDEVSRRVQDAALERLSSDLRPVPGMAELLAGFSGPRCVASSSDLERITLSLATARLAHHFEPARIFSAQMVTRGKPAPDLFLLAADTLGVEPARCLVVEDSVPGVTAAVAAGMEAVGFVAGGHARPALAQRLRAAGAEVVVERAADLADLLATRTALPPGSEA